MIKLSNIFAGLLHKSRHAVGGADALTPADIGAASADSVAGLQPLDADLTAYANALDSAARRALIGAVGATNLSATHAPTMVVINSDTGEDAPISAADGTNAGLLLPAEKTKLAGIATGATANSADATLLARANHTGTQLAATISDLSAAVVANAAVTANTAKTSNATHTGDASGATTLTLATVNSNVGAFGSATQIPTFTVNAKGLTTAAANTPIAIPSTQITDFASAARAQTEAALIAGANVTITPGSTGATRTLTVAATLSGGALVANPLSQFAATTSLQLKGVISDETGSGALVFATAPTLTDPIITGYVESVVAAGTVVSTKTLTLAAGTVQTATLTASTACTFTMPAQAAGESFVLYLKQAAVTGAGTATFTSVKWPGSTAPTITATAGRMDILSFVSDGTNWYGSAVQNFTY